MISFENDYLEGAHDKVLQSLVETNMVQVSGYGYDDFSRQAEALIQTAANCPQATVKFISGGTQTNQIVIASLLRQFEGVIASEQGHITTHEAGAIEFSGHKVLVLPSHDGKLDATEVRKYIKLCKDDPSRDHKPQPGMVYITHPTEVGTLYSKAELDALSTICQDYNVPLYIDGARLGYGLVAEDTDVTMADIAKYADVFYIGGTKIGALCGEAVVFTKNNEPEYFTTMLKQHGALMAKGRLIGIQFQALFTDDLYIDISQHAINQAMKIKEAFQTKGYQLYNNSSTNQQFVIMRDQEANKLAEKVKFTKWARYDDNHVIARFVTSWATTDENVASLLAVI